MSHISVLDLQTVNSVSSFYHWDNGRDQNENLLENSWTKLKVLKT